MKALQGTLRVVEDGLVAVGTPCSSFVFMNIATSGRSASNPLGHEDKWPYVLAANQCLPYIEKVDNVEPI